VDEPGPAAPASAGASSVGAHIANRIEQFLQIDGERTGTRTGHAAKCAFSSFTWFASVSRSAGKGSPISICAFLTFSHVSRRTKLAACL
jgi:hypothetical protein